MMMNVDRADAHVNSLNGILGAIVFRAAAPLLDRRIGDDRDGDYDQDYNARAGEPFSAVRRRRNPEIILADFSQNKPQHERRPRPSVEQHEIAERAEDERHDQVVNAVVRRERADEDQHEKERDKQRAANKSERGEMVENQEADAGDDDVRDDENPDHRERHVETRLEHLGSGLKPDDQQRSQEQRHARAAGNTEGDRRDQIAAARRVVGGARPEHALYGAFSRAAFIFEAARRMAVGDPLRDVRAQHGQYAEVDADQAAADHEPKVAEGVLDAFHHAFQLFFRRLRDGRRQG